MRPNGWPKRQSSTQNRLHRPETANALIDTAGSGSTKRSNLTPFILPDHRIGPVSGSVRRGLPSAQMHRSSRLPNKRAFVTVVGMSARILPPHHSKSLPNSKRHHTFECGDEKRTCF